ncbi:hypothetical protein [Methanobrevibacter sp.]|uniref:hypothetical protein n=1 Tax=Methanobrevibacter sp. TaxID=66852 RepID=UPI0025D033C8|nr:hypothetical protein [Methanobrevibacter sp.]MBQ2961530.1 hypothetical protein [Methanobrevibacter sp.]
MSILALIFIVIILSISAVSAAEDTTDDIISADEGQELILDDYSSTTFLFLNYF